MGNLVLRILQLVHPVVVLRKAVAVLRLAVLELSEGVRKLLLRVRLGLVIFRPAVVQLLPGIRKLLLAVADLLPGIFQLLPGIRNFLLAIGVILLALGIVLLALLIVPLALLILRLAIGEFPIGIVQLCLRIGPLGMILLPAIGDFHFRVGDLFHGFGVNGIVPHLRPLTKKLLYAVLQLVPPQAVGIGIGFPHVRHGQEHLVVDLEVKTVFRDVYRSGHAAAAQRAGPPLIVEVVGEPCQSHDGVSTAVEQFPDILIVFLRHGQHPAQVLLQEILRVPQALAGSLGHPARRQLGEVDAFRQGVGLHDHLNSLLDLREKVGIYRTPGGSHVLPGGKSVHILPGKAQGGQEPEIIEFLLLQIFDSGSHHIRLAGPQSGEKADSQTHNGQNRQIASRALADFPQGGAKQRLYHSISSTGAGQSLMSTDSTVPFFTWITRSAMAVRALLWVMMTTVMPFFRLISCKSFRMDLPVW